MTITKLRPPLTFDQDHLDARRTVANWCGSGRIQAVKLGDDWRVPRAEVQRLARGGG
jgi:excisionase family DNA binding protein